MVAYVALLFFFRDPSICPISRTYITVALPYFVDKHAMREILAMECYCSNHTNGCPFKGDINQMEVCFNLLAALHQIILLLWNSISFSDKLWPDRSLPGYILDPPLALSLRNHQIFIWFGYFLFLLFYLLSDTYYLVYDICLYL